MADIPVHPTVLEGDSAEDTAKTIDFFVQCGLMKQGDRFVPDQTRRPLDEEEDEIEVPAGNQCKDLCRAAYEIAKKGCNLSGNYKKCRKKAKAAYEICVAACDLEN